MTEQDCIYAAGLFDGEGCIQILPTKRGAAYRVTVTLNITFEPIVQWLKATFGGSVCSIAPKGNNARCWKWGLASRMAASFLEAVHPWLKMKDKEASLALEFQSRVKRTGRAHLSPEELSIRRDYQIRIKKLRAEMKEFI